MRLLAILASAAAACAVPDAICTNSVMELAASADVTIPDCATGVVLAVPVAADARVTVTAATGHLTTGDPEAEPVAGGFAFEPTASGKVRLDLTAPAGTVVPVTVLVEPGACTNDAREPNDDVAHATVLAAPALVQAKVCFGDVDAFAVDVPAGLALEAQIASLHPDLIKMDAVSEPGDLVAAKPGPSGPKLHAPWSPDGRRWVLRVTSDPPARVSYSLSVLVMDPGEPSALVSGTVRYLKRLGAADGTWSTDWRAVRRASVEVRAAAGDVVVATGRTGDAGEFVIAHPPGDIRVRVLARGTGPRLNVEVGDTDEVPWAATSGAGPSFDIDVSESYAAGAFNILEQATLVADALDGLVDAAPPQLLRVHWAPSLSPPCGSCYYDDDRTLDVSGEPGEEDAHDDAVILHELGHYVEATFGQYDNPGGLHDLEPVQPTLAWSEGFATWFQAAVRGTPLYVDLRPGGWAYVLDLESPPSKVKGGSESKLSEGLVYGVLWDLIDGGAGDDDGYQLATRDVLAVILALLDAQDLGAAGVDFVDFVNDWRCAHPDQEAALEAILAAFDYPPVAKEASCP